MPLLSQVEFFSKSKAILMMSLKILTCLYSFVSNFFFSFFFFLEGGAGGGGLVGGGGRRGHTKCIRGKLSRFLKMKGGFKSFSYNM